MAPQPKAQDAASAAAFSAIEDALNLNADAGEAAEAEAGAPKTDEAKPGEGPVGFDLPKPRAAAEPPSMRLPEVRDDELLAG